MKKVVSFGEIMLRLSPPGFQRFAQTTSFDAVYGGSESNALISVANFGIPVEFVTRLPENDLGDAAFRELRKLGVGTTHILRGGERLGIYFLEMGAVSRGSKVVYDRAHSAMCTIQPGMVDWDEVFRDAQWFHWSGITPAISQSAADACREAIRAAVRLGLTVSTDLNFRKNLWKYGKSHSEVMPELLADSDIILGIDEAVKAEHADSLGAGDILPACQAMMKKYPKAKKIALSLRGSVSASHNGWSGILYDGKKMHESRKYDITHIVDRVGGGDSFMGGLIYGLLTFKNDDQTALEFATAASCLKHTIFGDANLVTADEVNKLRLGDASGKVSR